MRGMGVLFNMYGGATEALEQEIANMKQNVANLNAQLSAEKNEHRKKKIREAIVKARQGMNAAKEKMKQLLRGVAETAGKAAAALSAGAKVAGKKLSAGLSSLGSKLSSGLSSLGSAFKGKIKDYKDRKAIERYYSEKAKEATSQMKSQKYEEDMKRRPSRSDTDSQSGGSYSEDDEDSSLFTFS
jgi:hypothetical protein